MCSFHSLMFSCLFLLLHLGLWLFHLLLHHQRPILEVLRRMFARKNSQPFTPIALAAPTETASHLHPLPWQRPQKQLVGGGINLIHTFAIIMSFFIMASCGGKYFYSSLQWEHSLAVIIGARPKHASRLCANWHMKPTMP